MPLKQFMSVYEKEILKPQPAPVPKAFSDRPDISVFLPVLNEERHLAESVRHVLGQDYPGPMELVLAVGPSADRTGQIGFAQWRPPPPVQSEDIIGAVMDEDAPQSLT